VSEYNGHPSRAHWNVSLWLYNTEPLYRLVQDVCRRSPDASAAARALLATLPSKTPDGYAYTFETVRAAIEDESFSGPVDSE